MREATVGSGGDRLPGAMSSRARTELVLYVIFFSATLPPT